MKLIDLNDDRVYTPADLKRDWAQVGTTSRSPA